MKLFHLKPGKCFKNYFLLSLSILGAPLAAATSKLKFGQEPPLVAIAPKEGGRVDGQSWDSSMLHGKVWILFYVDPDKRNTNTDFEQALKKANFGEKNLGSVAIINLAASWLPNAVLESSLESKQTEYPNTIYVKDLNKKLVQSWGVEDDAYNTLIFDKKGQLIYSYTGTFSNDETKKVLDLIAKNL